MLRIVIFAGGTGSIALQTGLHNLFGESAKVDVIISAYDNGKSTGECRKVFNGKILGPSDLRKNQLTQYHLVKGSANPEAEYIYSLFENRYSAANWEEYYNYAKKQIQETFQKIREIVEDASRYKKVENRLVFLLEYFFFNDFVSIDRKVRKKAITVDYTDFSIANIFYASAAALNNNSLGLAGQYISDLLNIENRVHLISDVNLYLHAETKKGTVISDEGVIVAWDNPNDPISKVKLLGEKGNEYLPAVDEDNQLSISCKQLVEAADIIIYSSGTQWSSLIPTYMHKDFRELLKNSKARKYLVMNNVPDKDMKGMNADDLCNTVKDYIDLCDVKIVLNQNADASMANVSMFPSSQIVSGELGKPMLKTHDPEKLVKAIMKDYYSEFLNPKFYFFDFDDTIWSSSKETSDRSISKDNLRLLYKCFAYKSALISGNSSKHFESLKDEFSEAQKLSGVENREITIYCNGGNCVNKMVDGDFQYQYNICDEYNLNNDYYLISEQLLKSLNRNGWNLSFGNFENRGNCILSVKPLANREKAKSIIDAELFKLFKDTEHSYSAYINGRTTIDIMNTNYTKKMCSVAIMDKLSLKPEEVVYIGDKTDGGNDSFAMDMGFKVMSVDDIKMFNCFAKLYNEIGNE